MKKIIKLLIFIMLFASTTLGCEVNKKNEVKENDIKEEKIDIKSNENNEENDSIVEETQTYDYDDILVVYKYYNLKNGEVFSKLKAYDKDDKVLWEFTSDTVADVQFPVYEFLGGYNDVVLLKENKDIIVFDIKTGKERKRIKDVNYGLDFFAYDFVPDKNGDSGKNYLFINAANGLSIEFLEKVYIYDADTFELVKIVNMPEKFQNEEYRIEEHGGGKFITFIEYHTTGNIEHTIALTDMLEDNFESKYKNN